MKSTGNPARILFLSAPRGAGKTTWILAFSTYLKENHQSHFGVATPKIFEDDAPQSIGVCDLAAGVTIPLAVRDDLPGVRVGLWRFFPDSISFANHACNPHGHEGIALIDEIGPLELGGNGFQVALNALKSGLYPAALVVVRPELALTLGQLIGHDGEHNTIGPDADFRSVLDFLAPPVQDDGLLADIPPGC